MKITKEIKRNFTDDQITYIMVGERKANELQVMIEESLGIADHIKVLAKNQAMIEGPPGIGKTFTTRKTIESHGIQPVFVGTGSSKSDLAGKFAYADYYTPKDKKIVVIWDDADDVVFGVKKEANIWKNVFMDKDENPKFIHSVNLGGELKKLEKDKRTQPIAKAMRAYMPDDSMGIEVPLDRFMHIFLTNTDYDTKSQTKTFQWMEPIVDRFNYNRLQYEWSTAWGWLSYILLNSQPFEDDGYNLTLEQKIRLLTWLFDHWDKMGNKQTYRTVKEMSQYIINEPDNFLNRWNKFIRIQNGK